MNRRVAKAAAAFTLTLAAALTMAAAKHGEKYIWPIAETRRVSGTFAEFRSDHFHSGLDISTQGRMGVPVFCSRSGKITRVKVSQTGFGRALYVTHAEGTVAVYGHLLAFLPALEDEVFARQTKKNGFELDFQPSPAIEVRQGEALAYSGNSGTTGPHLHFELRDTLSRPLDPTAEVGADYETWPETRRLVFYPLSPSSRVNGSSAPVEIQPVRRGTDFRIEENVRFCGYLGIGIDAVQMNWGNKLGVKSVALECDGKPVWSCGFDVFSYDDYKNTGPFYDRRLLIRNGGHVLKLFCTDGAKKLPFMRDEASGLGVFCSTGQKGLVPLPAGRHKIRITVTAFDGKTSKTEFKLDPASLPGGPEDMTGLVMHSRIKMPSQDGAAVLETGPLVRRCLPEEDFSVTESDALSTRAPELELGPRVYSFGPDSAESRDSVVTLRIPEKFLPRADRVRIYERAGNGWAFAGGKVDAKAGTVSAGVSFFGAFTAGIDSVPPRIRVVNLPAFAEGGYAEFAVEDGGSGPDIGSVVLVIDSIRCFPYFNRKTGTFRWDMRKSIGKGRHEAVISAADRAGNANTLRATFETA